MNPEVDKGQVIEQPEEQAAPAMPTETNEPTEVPGELPDAASERTKAEFLKLKNHNKALAEELAQAKSAQYGTSVFDNVYGQNTPKTQTVPKVPTVQHEQGNFVDANGFVDAEALQRSYKETSERAARAEAEARQTREYIRQRDEEAQIKEAHRDFPSLNPANTGQFDPQAFALVRDRLVSNMVNGKKQTVSEVASDIYKFYKPQVQTEELKEQAVTEYKDKQTAKAQASSVQSGKGQPREEGSRLEDLRTRTSLGDDAALNERLAKLTS